MVLLLWKIHGLLCLCILFFYGRRVNAIYCHKCKIENDLCKWELNEQLCMYTEIRSKEITFPSENETTAPAPESCTVNCTVNNISNKSLIGFNLSWTQKVPLHGTNGFYIEIFHSNSKIKYLHVRFNVFDVFNHLSQQQKDYKKIPFDLLYYHEEFIQQDHQYHFSFLSSPLFHQDIRIHVKECRTEFFLPWKKECMKKQHLSDFQMTTKTETFYDQPDEKSEVPWLGYGLIVLCCVLFAACAIFCIRRIRSRCLFQGIDPSSLLIIINTGDEDLAYLDASNIIASIVGEGPSFNLWEQNCLDKHLWLVNHLNQCKHIMIIFTPQGTILWNEFQKHDLNDYSNCFLSVLSKLMNDKLSKHTVTTVCFDKNCDFIPKKISKLGKCFQLPEELDAFFKYVVRKPGQRANCSEQIELLKSKVLEIRMCTYC